MKRYMVIALGIVLLVPGLSGVGSAQPVVRVEGVLEGVDCQANSVVLKMPDGVHVFQANRYTGVSVDSTSVDLCALNQYVGSHVTVSLTASESQFVAGRVDVFTTIPAPSGTGYSTPAYPYAPVYAAPYGYAPYPAPYYEPLSYYYGPYAGNNPYYYGPAVSIGFGIGYGPVYYSGYYHPAYHYPAYYHPAYYPAHYHPAFFGRGYFGPATFHR